MVFGVCTVLQGCLFVYRTVSAGSFSFCANNPKRLIHSVCYSTRTSTQQLQLLHALLPMKTPASSSCSSGGDSTLRPPLPFEYLRVSDKEVRCHQAQVAKVHLSTPKNDQTSKRGRWRIRRFPSLRVELFGPHPDVNKQHVHTPPQFMHACTLGVLSDSVDILHPLPFTPAL